MSFSARDIIPILMILASIGGLFGLVQPRYETIKSLRAEKAQYEDTLEKANEATRIMRETLLAQYNAIDSESWKRLDKMLPGRADGVQLARDMDGLAKVFNIKLNGFSFAEETPSAPAANPSAGLPVPPAGEAGNGGGTGTEGAPAIQIPTTQTPQVKKLKLSFSFEATYPDFMRYLRELEKNLELSDVRSISLSRSGSVGGAKGNLKAPEVNLYSIDLQIDTYWIE